MTPENCLTPSQEATKLQRELLETEQKLRRCEHALNSERWFRKQDKKALDKMRAELAECYRLSGADPDGAPDSMLAPYAVQEVKLMRKEWDEAIDLCAELEAKGSVSASEGSYHSKAYGGSE